MEVEFSENAQGIKTCLVKGVRLHSSYNPQKEAERFVENLECSFNPLYVVVTEPALSYCAAPLKKKYPSAILCAVRYDRAFDSYNSLFDKIFYADDKNLEDELFNFMGEEGTSSALFASWQPSQKAFPLENEYAWNSIKSCVLKSRSVLATREYFSKRWVKNSFRFALFVKKTAFIEKGNIPVVLCASGPSLKSSLSFIKEYRKHFFLAAVSSALLPLLNHEIVPDLVVSTDGGYYAKRHLTKLCKNNLIPLALPLEGASYSKILKENILIPLSYGDGISEDILFEFGFKGTKAKRNGTVSGTTANLALDFTSADVFFCGLDLSPSQGYSHTQPNMLEEDESFKNTRLFTKETRLTPSSFRSPSLDLYREWFSSADFKGRLFRLSCDFNYTSRLKSVKDVNWAYFHSYIKKLEENNHSLLPPKVLSGDFSVNHDERVRKILSLVKNKGLSTKWIKEALPAKAVISGRSQNQEAGTELREEMESFTDDVLRSIGLQKG